MKIKKIKYQNFRQFAKEGEISFDTDGKVTIVYGTNGDGKTTLHQLFQWILYNKVTFNKTTSESKLYNLGKAAELKQETSFVVWGEIEFEHDNKPYLMRREYTYYKNKSDNIIHKSEYDQFFVQTRNENNDWKTIESPEAFVEEILPPGLSSYFFFDGETMIADLKIRGTDSAKTLRKALYSIFDLEAYEKALDDIGRIGRSQSVLGQLEAKRLKAAETGATDKVQKQHLRDIKILSRKKEECETENAEYEEEIKEIGDRLTEISELIGTSKSKAQMERYRKNFVENKKSKMECIKKEMLRFGKEIEQNYAYLLITEVVKNADSRLYMQVQDEEKRIIPGLTKELLINLLKNSNECICGRSVGKEEVAKLEEWKSFFPPTSYKSTYDKFKRKAIRYSGHYDGNKLYDYLKNILQFKKDISDIENQIEDIDENLKNCGNIEELIDERTDKEKKKNIIEKKLKENMAFIGDFDHQLKIRQRILSNFDRANADVDKYKRKIQFMEQVAEQIKAEMNAEVKDYSKMLEKEIQFLIENMLTSKRSVSLTEDFQLQVTDSYKDESKSEGQFAVVSFAYIGGIFKVLKSHEKLQNKEYPLVLDGPFSKLDPKQKGNVVKTIPEYAPQVIIFSKDPLQDYISLEKMGKIWTIKSNEEKNDAVIEEGYWW